jgi:hypothetical protein
MLTLYFVKRRTILCLAPQVFAALALSALLCSPSFAQEAPQIQNETMQTQTFSGKKRYVHPCPEGTEAVGKNPPEGKRIFCRQSIVGGYRKHGTYTTWYHNGQARVVGEYHAGKRHGVWKYYHKNGKPKSIARYYDDELVEETVFGPDGKAVPADEKKQKREEIRKKNSWKAEVWNKHAKPLKKNKKNSWISTSGSRRRVKLF